MRLIEYWMEKTAGWKKKLIQSRLAAGKAMPSAKEFDDIYKKLYKTDITKLPGYSGYARAHNSPLVNSVDESYFKELINNPDLSNFLSSRRALRHDKILSEKYGRHRSKGRYLSSRLQQMIDVHKKNYKILNEGIDSLGAPKSGQRRVMPRSETVSDLVNIDGNADSTYAAFAVPSMFKGLKIRHTLDPLSLLPTSEEIMKTHPEVRKQFFSGRELLKRLSKDYGHRVKPQDLAYRSGKIQAQPGDKEIFVSGYPQVAMGYGNLSNPQFNVVKRREVPGVFTPHLATTAQSLADDVGRLNIGKDPISVGNNLRTMAAIYNRNFGGNFMPRGLPTYYPHGNKNWNYLPEYEATVNPAQLKNAPSLRSFFTVSPGAGLGQNNLSDGNILKNTLLGDASAFRDFGKAYQKKLLSQPYFQKYLSQFRGSARKPGTNDFLQGLSFLPNFDSPSFS